MGAVRQLKESKPNECPTGRPHRWRVVASVDGRRVYGPSRVRKAQADADLKRARRAQTRQEYAEILTRSGRIRTRRRFNYAEIPIAQLGVITADSNGWRVSMCAKKTDTGTLSRAQRNCPHGPYRARRSIALADLKQARKAQSHAEFCDTLRQLEQAVSLPAGPQKNLRRDDRQPLDKRKPVSQLGTTRPHGNGWRVIATIEDRTICGPYRADKIDAEMDLKRARTAESREDYAVILSQLKGKTQAKTGSETEEDGRLQDDEGIEVVQTGKESQVQNDEVHQLMRVKDDEARGDAATTSDDVRGGK